MTYHQHIATPDEIERLLFHMKSVARLAENEWASGFARSVLRHSKRPDWRPSPKQFACMRRLTSELFTHVDEIDLIEK